VNENDISAILLSCKPLCSKAHKRFVFFFKGHLEYATPPKGQHHLITANK